MTSPCYATGGRSRKPGFGREAGAPRRSAPDSVRIASPQGGPSLRAGVLDTRQDNSRRCPDDQAQPRCVSRVGCSDWLSCNLPPAGEVVPQRLVDGFRIRKRYRQVRVDDDYVATFLASSCVLSADAGSYEFDRIFRSKIVVFTLTHRLAAHGVSSDERKRLEFYHRARCARQPVGVPPPKHRKSRISILPQSGQGQGLSMTTDPQTQCTPRRRQCRASPGSLLPCPNPIRIALPNLQLDIWLSGVTSGASAGATD